MRKTALLPLIFLTGCVTYEPVFTPEQEKAIGQACVDEVKAPGVYTVSPGRKSPDVDSTLPRASGIAHLGGTQAGAEQINACIRRNAPG